MVRKTGVRAGNRQRRSSPPIQGSSASKNIKKAASSVKKSQPKKEAQIQEEPSPAPSPADAALTHEQQLALNVFRDTFHTILSSPDFTTTLQSVKQALFDRDFTRAFSSNDYLSVYAARYSPTRAICYSAILTSIRSHLDQISSPPPPPSSGSQDGPTSTSLADPNIPVLRHLSLGGNTAEVVAFASFLRSAQLTSPLSGQLSLLDSAAWGTVVAQLWANMTEMLPPTDSPSPPKELYISPFLFPHPHIHQLSAFSLDESTFSGLLNFSSGLKIEGAAARPLLVSLLFTLNELFAASLSKTTRLLLDLTSHIPIGSLLLVVDSPGSYSETTLGSSAKRYPMQWLLDRIMLGTQEEPVNGRRWKKLEGKESVWCRLGEGLEYPIKLENMRYQMHLYKAEEAI